MIKIFKRTAVRIAIVVGAVGVLSSCSATQMADSGMSGGKLGGEQSFAFSVSSRHELLKRGTSGTSVTQEKSAKAEKVPSKNAAKAKIATAKKQADRDAKRLADFDTMLARLPEAQHKYFRKQRERIASAAEKSKAAHGKLAYKAMPRSAGKGGARYHALIAKHAAANGVPLKLAHAVVRVESAYRANARGGAGEIGLMQIKLATARGMGYRGSAKGLYDPDTNIRWGMKYLGKAHKLAGGSTCGTILKYNAGHGAKRMNPISRRYCNKVARYI